MNRLFPQNPTSSLSLSQQRKKFREHKFSTSSLCTQKSESPSITSSNLYQEDNMPVQVSDELRQWLTSYFSEYSPSGKSYQTQGGEDKFFHKVGKFLLEVAFVSPRFYCMPKKRVGFIISTYEGEVFDWALWTAEALREQLNGLQSGKPMKLIFTKWLAVLCPTPSSESRQSTS